MDDKDIEIERLKKELAHVKANNANLTERNRILRIRDDLPVDRLPYITKLDDLETELNLARQYIDELHSRIKNG